MKATEQRKPSNEPGFRPVVIAPTYNNAASVIGVLERIERVGTAMIVVDDGATDATPLLLADWMEKPHEVPVQLVTHEQNRGKAAALRTGFAEASRLGFTHAVTMDTDGQLEPEEVPRLLAAAQATPDALVLGRRRKDTPRLPKSNLVGWYTSGLGLWLEIGVVVHDSQCGMRVYPLRLFDVVKPWAGRFGFEAEIIARAVWAGCPIVDVPVSCHYPPHEERVSHLRPWRDGAKGFFMHWGLAIRRLIPWPEPKLGGAGLASHAQVSDAVAPRRLKPAARDEGGMAKPVDEGGMAKPARSSHEEPPTHRGGRRHVDTDADKPAWSGVPYRPKTGLAAWCQWASPLSLWRQIRSSRLEQLIASSAFAHGVFIACMPFGLWAFAVAVYGSRRLHHSLWAAVLGATLSIPPIGPLLAKIAISIIYVPTHFALPDFTAVSPGAPYVGMLFRAYPISWCLGGALLGTILHWVTIVTLTWLFRRIPVNEPD